MRVWLARFGLMIASLAVSFLLAEMGYRLFDPFPYYSPSEINHTEHGNLTEYDPLLGWKGVDAGEAALVTKHNRVWLKHNAEGFRDIEHDPVVRKPAIVFLGDSFTWGYEVEFDEMFVTLLREELLDHELFNLAHRGHGTDQQLLTFRGWRRELEVEHVVLMFSPNDVDDNNSTMRSMKAKPKFEIRGDDLVLTGTPVPRVEGWVDGRGGGGSGGRRTAGWKRVAFRSHFAHDLWVHYREWREPRSEERRRPLSGKRPERALALTFRILTELEAEAGSRGGDLTIFFIPARRQLEEEDDWVPYQQALLEWCEGEGIAAIDLAPALRRSWLRSYYRGGGHWNRRGHEIAAREIREHLVERVSLPRPR